MRPGYLDCKRLARFLSFSILCLLLYTSSAGIALGQKEPKSLKLDTSTDDKQLCDADKKDSQFCVYYNQYHDDDASVEEKTAARNEMIDLLVGQIDTYYKMRKDGRKGRIRFLQTFLDFLDVAATTAVAIVSGERVKTIIGAASTGMRGGRTSFEKNFEVLQTQVLVNKMNANRAEMRLEILRAQNNPSNEYGWYAAKNDLRRYLFAGTFNNALDTLVIETGVEVANAERELRVLEKRTRLDDPTPEEISIVETYNETIQRLETELVTNATKTTATLRSIIAELTEISELNEILTQGGITIDSSGQEILDSIPALKIVVDQSNLTAAQKSTLISKIEAVVIRTGAK